MIVIVAGKTVKGPVTVDIKGAEPLSSDSASAMDAPGD